MFVQVSRQVGRPNFQAGHAGSIPVIRSSSSASCFERFLACPQGFRAVAYPIAYIRAHVWLGPRRCRCEYQAMVNVTVEARNDIDNP
jgi:hypothetical protein